MAELKGIMSIIQNRSKSSGSAVNAMLMNTPESIPDKPTKARLERLIALANDERGDPMTRRAAKRKLAMYHKFYPQLLKRIDDSRKDR